VESGWNADPPDPVHMAHIGHPVAGDPVYGPKKSALGLAISASTPKP
jgi:23S rRNA-/tRNA-specific pseudouridylate synthase